MEAPDTTTEAPPSRPEALAILADTAHAVKVMKASWLRVALNLRRIRRHELWRLARPKCENYEDYVLGVLKLNKYVAARMLRAVDYTEERRPDVIERFYERGDEVEVPSFEAVDQLRRAAPAFSDQDDDLRHLEAQVFDEGVGRIHLRREINERLGRAEGGAEKGQNGEAAGAPQTVAEIVEVLKGLERQLLKLQVSKEARRLMFQLVEALEGGK
jgi:hypothetical protein